MAQQEGQNGVTVQVTTPAVVSFTAVKPQLLVEAPKANDAISFYKAAFGVEEVARTLDPKRKAEQEVPLVLSAEVKIGGFSVIVSDLVNDSSDATKNGGNKVAVCMETSDVAAAVVKAVGAGAVEEGEFEEGEGACCGGRVGKVRDPYGFVWVIYSSSKNKGVEEGNLLKGKVPTIFGSQSYMIDEWGDLTPPGL